MTPDFDWTIAPVTRDAFFRDSFEKKHLVIRRDDPGYYSDLLSIHDIDWALTTLGLAVPEINITRADAEITQADFAYETGYVDPVAATRLFADGATIILSNLQERLPKLADFCRALEKVFSARVQTNIYLTPAHSQGFKAHYDGHDVLVLQVEGTKEWRIYDTPVALPLADQGFDPAEVPIGEETDRFVLNPGDMVYVPRGLTHDAVSTDQTSLHITTGLMVRSWADLMCEVVRQAAHDNVEFRQALPPGFANEGADTGAMRAQFAALMEVLTATDFTPVLEDFREDFIGSRPPRVHGQMAALSRLSELTPQSRLCARPNLIYRLMDVPGKNGEPDTVAVSCQGAVLSMPDYARDPLERALSGDVFTLADLPGDLDEPGRAVLVRRLMREGLVTFND